MLRLSILISIMLLCDNLIGQSSDALSEYQWLRVLVDSIENETDLCTTCPSPPEIKSYSTLQGVLRFRMRYACDDSSSVQTFYDGAGTVLGICFFGDASGCEDLSLTTSYTFGQNIVTAWSCDIGYTCPEVNRFDLFAPYDIIIDGDACIDNQRDISVSNLFEEYSWMAPDGTIDDASSIVAEQSGLYTLIVTDEDGCKDTSQIEIDVAMPLTLDISGPTVICDDPIELSLSGYLSYMWSNGSTDSTILVDQPGIYTITVINDGGCTEEAMVSIEDHRNKRINLINNYEEIYEGQIVEFNTELVNIQADEIIELNWHMNNLPVADAQESIGFQIDENTSLRVSLLANSGCTFSDSIWLEVLPVFRDYYIPNIFNPNSSTANDRFFVQGLSGTVLLRNLSIYDRWGMPVYESMQPDINDHENGWDGTKRGQALPSGNYVYTVEVEFANGTKEYASGTILLIW